MMKKLKLVVTTVTIASLVLSFFAQTVSALEITVTENGTGSSNEVITNTSSETTVVQSNDLQVTNDVTVDANTGENGVTDSGGGADISTGDVASEVTVSNSGNFSSTEIDCCSEEETKVAISGNGSDSTSQVGLIQNAESTVSISQNAYITNEVNGYANTGNNSAEGNMGSVLIKTGDIKIKETMINDPINLASVKVGNGLGGVSIKIKENGSDSENEISAQFLKNSDVFVDQRAEFKNVSDWYLETGGNKAEDNMGDVDIETGDITYDSFIKNFANIGGVEVSCCEEVSPSPDPGGEETPSGDVGGNENDEKKEGSLLPSAAATEAGGPGIIGLSDTSSQSARALFFFLSLAFIAFGGKIMTEEIFPKTSKRKL